MITELLDDIDGTPADETVTFGLDGTDFEIDLTAHRAGILRDILGDYVQHGRKLSKASVATARPASNGSNAKSNKEHTQAIREWARRAGHQVSERGRIKAEVVDAFEQAHRALASVG